MADKDRNETLIKLRGNRTRQEVADAIGITARSLQSYELGERQPSDGVKIKLAKFYNRSVQYIFFKEVAHSE